MMNAIGMFYEVDFDQDGDINVADHGRLCGLHVGTGQYLSAGRLRCERLCRC